MKNQQQKFQFKITYLDDNGKRRTKEPAYHANTISEASKQLRWQYRSVTELDILSWEIVKENLTSPASGQER